MSWLQRKKITHIARCGFKTKFHKRLMQHVQSNKCVKKRQCKQCFDSFDTKEQLREHKKSTQCKRTVCKLNLENRRKFRQWKKGQALKEDEKQEFACAPCNLKFETFKDCFDHLQEAHKESLDCIICDQKFDKNIELLAHVKRHAPNLYCGHHFKAFKTRKELLQHIRAPGHNLECGVCGKRFETRMKRDSHRRTHLDNRKDKKDIKCPHCPLIFGYSGNLSRHIRTVHEKRVFLCEDCGSSFTTKFDLGVHVAKVHGKKPLPPKNKPVQCELCGRTFREMIMLKLHKAEHLGHTEICEYCKETFENVEKLNEHIEETGHHVFQCEKCPSKFKNKAHLIAHLMKHDKLKSGKKPLRLGKGTELWYGRKHFTYTKTSDGKFECNVCQKQFSGSSNVVRHFDIHSEAPKYRCHICGKMFKQKPGLKNHLAVHSDERPLACKICGSRFKDTSTLSKHRRAHFKNQTVVNPTVTMSTIPTLNNHLNIPINTQTNR